MAVTRVSAVPSTLDVNIGSHPKRAGTARRIVQSGAVDPATEIPGL